MSFNVRRSKQNSIGRKKEESPFFSHFCFQKSCFFLFWMCNLAREKRCLKKSGLQSGGWPNNPHPHLLVGMREKRVQALTGGKHSPLRIGAVGTHVVGFLSKGLLRKAYPLVIFPGCGTRIIVGRFVFRVQIENWSLSFIIFIIIILGQRRFFLWTSCVAAWF